MTSIEFVIQTDITLNIYYKILSIFQKNVVIWNFGSHFGIIHNFNYSMIVQWTLQFRGKGLLWFIIQIDNELLSVIITQCIIIPKASILNIGSHLGIFQYLFENKCAHCYSELISLILFAILTIIERLVITEDCFFMKNGGHIEFWQPSWNFCVIFWIA